MQQGRLFENATVEDGTVEYQSNDLSHEESSVHFLVAITVVYLIILIIGLVGNTITCVVIITNRSMRTVPNCYLFNLAVSDQVLLLSGLPFEIITIWKPHKYDFGDVGCFMRALLLEISTNVSILTITAFTFERYLAVCRPISTQLMSKLPRAIKLIIVIWIISLICATVIACQSVDLAINDEYECVFDASIPYSLDIMALLFFVAPLLIITILYILIGRSLRKSEKMEGRQSQCTDRHSKGILKMLVVIVVVFFICWAPFQGQRMLSAHQSEVLFIKYKDMIWWLTDGLYHISGIFYFVSGAINPIIYNIMSNKFRDAFKETLSKSCFLKNEAPTSLP